MGESTRAKMNGALLEQYEGIGELLVRATTTYARRWYEIGVRVRVVMANPRAYGARAVLVLAKALGKKSGALYDAAKVAGVWTKDELVALLERPNVVRQPLTFSHLVILAEAGSRRGPLLEQTLARGWSVRELRRRWLAPSPTRDQGAVALARRGTRRISHLAGEVEKMAELLPSLGPEAARAELDALRELRHRLTGALAKLEALHEELVPSSRGDGWGTETVVREA